MRLATTAAREKLKIYATFSFNFNRLSLFIYCLRNLFELEISTFFFIYHNVGMIQQMKSSILYRYLRLYELCIPNT